MKIRTLLVDSSFLLKRSFFGAKNLYSDSFGHIGALYSFFTTLRKLVKDHKINKVVLVWDGENGGYYRHLIEPSYKANRKDKEWYQPIELSDYEIKKEEEKKISILKQKKRIQAYAEELFFRQIEVEKIEADDLIASYVFKFSENEDIYLYANDRDFAQLLDKNITILFDNIDEPVTKHNFFFIFNYHYSNALIIKVMCGDTADNLKGVKGIGEKTLLEHFPDLKFKPMMVRDICKEADNINKERVKNKKKPLKSLQNILESLDLLKTNYKLMNLSEPFLTEEAEEEIEYLDLPLSDEDRGSKFLYEMMTHDQFLNEYKGSFRNYVEPFYTVIMSEKKILKEYLKANKTL